MPLTKGPFQMENFKFEPLKDANYYLDVPAKIMETYVRYVSTKLAKDAVGAPVINEADLYDLVANHLRKYNLLTIQRRFSGNLNGGMLTSDQSRQLRRDSLSPIIGQRVIGDLANANRLLPTVAPRELVTAGISDNERELRMNRTTAELESIYANRFGASTDFPDAYRKVLSDYMTDKDLRELERAWSADSRENFALTIKQARRAVDVLETLENQFRGMYRIRVGNESSEIRAEMIDLPGTKIVLLPARNLRGSTRETAEEAAVRNVGTVLMNDNIYALAEPVFKNAHGRYADSQIAENVPGQIVIEAMLLNTVDGHNRYRLERNTQPQGEGVTHVSAVTLRPNEQVTNAMLATRSRPRSVVKRGDRTINEMIRANSTSVRVFSVMNVNYKYREGDPRQVGVNPRMNAAIVCIPQAPVNAIATTGDDRLRSIDRAITAAAKAEDVVAQLDQISNFEEAKENDLDTMFLDDLDVDFADVSVAGIADSTSEDYDDAAESVSDLSNLTVMGQTRRDELIELRERMDFNATPDNPIRVVDLEQHVWYGPRDATPEGEEQYRLTPMEDYILEDLQRLGVTPKAIRSNKKGSYQIDIPEIMGGKYTTPDSYNTIHLALGQLNNFDRDLGGYVVKYNEAIKGVFIPGYRLTIDRYTGAPQVVEFSDIVREAFHTSMMSQLTNPSAANDTIDPYLALDKVITTYGYGTLFTDMDPKNLSDAQKVVIEQARHKARYMTSISDSATMFNVVGDGSDNPTPNQRIQFANNESIRVPILRFDHLFDRTKSSPGGESQYLGTKTLIDANGRLYSNEITPITTLTNAEAEEQGLFEVAVNGYEHALSPMSLAYPSTQFDEHARQTAVAQQLSRLGTPNSVIDASVAYTTSGGFGIGDGFVVSKAFADKIDLHLKHGEVRNVVIGDKLTDIHGDKGIAVMVVDPDATGDRLKHLTAVFAANPELEIVAPYGTLLSRGTGGVAREMEENYIGQLNDAEVDGETIHLSNVSYSHMKIGLSDMNVTDKTKVYTREEYNATNKGRAASGQLNAALMSLGAKRTLAHIYSSGSYNGQDLGHARLISDLNVLGYDIDADGNFGKINTTALLQDPGTVIVDPRNHMNFDELSQNTADLSRFGVKFGKALAAASNREGATRVAIDLGENVKLSSGVTSEGVDANGRVRNVLFLPLAYLKEVNDLGKEQESLVLKDAYRNRLKTIYDYVAGNGKRDKSLTELINRLSTTVISRSFAKKDNVVKSKVYSVPLSESGTLVATADPTLPLNTVRISPEMWRNAGSPDPEKGERFLIWRDPVLRPTNTAAYKFIVDENITGIALNPILADKKDGDFDGDSFGAKFTSDPEVQAEWATKLAAENLAQLYRKTVDEGEVTLLDINGDVKMPYLVRQDKALDTIVDAWLDSDSTRKSFESTLSDLKRDVDPASDLGIALDSMTYDMGEILQDSPELTPDAYKDLVKSDLRIYMPDLLADDTVRASLFSDTSDAADTFEREGESIRKMTTSETSYDELEKLVMDDGLFSAEAFGEFGLDVRSREAIYNSIAKPFAVGYSSKSGAVEKFMMHYDNNQSLGDYMSGASGNGYKSDFVGVPGTLQQVLIARLRGTTEGCINEKVDATPLDKAIHLDDAQRAMRAALQITWIATDGTLQAKKAPENGRLIQELASNDLRNLVNGYPRDFKPTAYKPEPSFHLSNEDWVAQMTEVLVNPNKQPRNWNELHPGVEFKPGLDAGAMLDMRDLQVIADALSDDKGRVRFLTDDLSEKRISAFDAICYSGALFGKSDGAAGLAGALEYGLTVTGNDYQNMFSPSDKHMWAPSVLDAHNRPTVTQRSNADLVPEPADIHIDVDSIDDPMFVAHVTSEERFEAEQSAVENDMNF